jgi:alpha-1,2-mannosyltransferase
MQNNDNKLVKNNKSWLIAAIIISVIEVGFIIFYHFHSGFHRTVVGSYFDAAINWIHGNPIYIIDFVGGFNYFIQSAILFIPFALFPLRVCILLWLFLNVYLLWLSVSLIVKNFKKNNSHFIPRLYLFWMLVWCLGLGFSGLRNGQMNLFIMILTLFVAYSLQRKKDGWVCFWLTLGLALKPTMIILYLLVLGCRPKVFPKLLLGLIIVMAFPFLTQSPNYVISQYYDSWLNFTSTVNIGVNSTNWASFFDCLKVLNLGLSHNLVNIIIVMMALLTYFYALFLYKRNNFHNWCWSLACIATIYLLLFNPRTESTGYILLAPFIGYAIANAWQYKKYFRVIFVFSTGVLIALNYDISRHLIHGTTSWVAPLVTAVFAIYWIFYVDLSITEKSNEKIIKSIKSNDSVSAAFNPS